MLSLADRFHNLSASQKRYVQQTLCDHALAKWREFREAKGGMAYVESVCCTCQNVDRELPTDAMRSVRAGEDMAEVDRRYGEPITALQDGDLYFPEPITFAYYAIYNLFNKYVRREAIDDWLIVNQALSAESDESRWLPLLEAAIQQSCVEAK